MCDFTQLHRQVYTSVLFQLARHFVVGIHVSFRGVDRVFIELFEYQHFY